MKNKKELQVLILYLALTVLSMYSLYNSNQNYKMILEIKQQEQLIIQSIEKSVKLLDQMTERFQDN